ncbi:MAG: PAS domain S-box protein [Leadbetterella sp.]|nr:PAS domain S-box protein [Leadbetterella sp.]
MKQEIELLERKISRERDARLQAEKILEAKAFELYEVNEKLHKLNLELEAKVLERSESLMRSQIQYKLLIQNLQSSLLLEDENRKIVIANKNFCELFHIPLSPEELTGVDCTTSAEQSKHLFKEPEAFVERIDSLLNSKKIELKEELITADNRILERDYIPIFSGEKYLGHLWLYNDVTEQKAVQNLLQQSEEKYRGIIENMELGLMEVDNHDVIQKVYQRFCKLTGYEEYELLGKKAADILLPNELFKGLIAEQNEIRRSGEPGAYEVPLKKKDGEIIWVIISGAPIKDGNGKVTGSVGIHLDITERKRTQEALEEARATAEDARNSEKRFLANMSHEIRTPINAIIGMTHLMYDTKPNEKQTEYLSAINYSTDLLLNLVSDILDISKIEAGEMKMSENIFSLKDLLNSTLQTFQIEARTKNIELTFEYDDDISNEVIGDATFMSQIMLNLLSNAMKFTKKGKIGIQVSLLCKLGEFYMTEFKVSDTGVGISENEINRIFDSFKQANETVKTTFGGTGLGLAIVKQLVNIHGGEITAESTLGEGTVFNFTLPLKDSGQKTKVVTDLSVNISESWKNFLILIVEDNEMNQKYVTGLMEKWGLRYRIASDKGEVLEMIDAYVFDLILMDILLPDTNGYWLTEYIRLKEKNLNQNIPIIGLSATAMNEEIEQAYAAGMNGYVTKPFRPDQLKVVLEETLQKIIPQSRPPQAPINNYNIGDNLRHLYGDDKEYAQVMINLFQKTVPLEIERIRTLMKEKNCEALGKVTHQIKPSFSMVGFPELTEELQIIERTIKGGAKFEDFRNLIDDFLGKFEPCIALLNNELENL